MKKLLLLVGLVLAFSYSPNSIEAQTLTKAEVQANLPQLTNAVVSLNAATSHINARINTENALLRQYSNLLSSLSLKINSSTLTNTELQSISNTLTEMQTMIVVMNDWRTQVKTTTANIVKILGNIQVMISTAA